MIQTAEQFALAERLEKSRGRFEYLCPLQGRWLAPNRPFGPHWFVTMGYEIRAKGNIAPDPRLELIAEVRTLLAKLEETIRA